MASADEGGREELAGRLRELQEHLGLADAAFAKLFGRARRQAISWRAADQLPHWRVLEQAAEANGWPVEIFQDGGPRPADVVNRAVNARQDARVGIVAEPRPAEPYGAGAVQGAALVALGDYLVPGAPFDVLQKLIERVYEAGRAAGRSEQGGPLADRG